MVELKNKYWILIIALFFAIGIAKADTNTSFSVHWEYPADGSTNDSRTITVGFTPWWIDVPDTVCTLNINDSTYRIDNQTELINDTLNTITYEYPADGYYKNSIECENGSTGHSSEITYFTIDTTNPAFSATWNYPDNASINDSSLIEVGYTPIWYDVPTNYCMLNINGSGDVSQNQSELINDTINTITYDYGTNGDYESYVYCFNGTDLQNSDINYITINVLYSGLVANWTFNEGSGSTAYDTSPFGNNCTINNATWVSGVKGDALDFNGFDSYLDCGNDSSLNFGTGNFTIMAWIKGTNPQHFIEYDTDILGKTDDFNDGYTLMLSNYSDDANFYVWANIIGDNVNNVLSPNFNLGSWHLITLVRNEDNLEFYLDGILKNDTIIIGDTYDTINNFSIGDMFITDHLPFEGTIDEVRMWNKSLSNSQILQMYNDEKPINSAFNVVWNSPQNNSINDSTLIKVDYTPVWYDIELTNGCSLWVNSSAMTYNATPLINDTINSITYDYGADGSYESYINCANTTDNNWTATIYFSINTTLPAPSGYIPHYTSGDFPAIMVDAIGTGGVEIVEVIGLVVLGLTIDYAYKKVKKK